MPDSGSFLASPSHTLSLLLPAPSWLQHSLHEDRKLVLGAAVMLQEGDRESLLSHHPPPALASQQLEGKGQRWPVCTGLCTCREQSCRVNDAGTPNPAPHPDTLMETWWTQPSTARWLPCCRMAFLRIGYKAFLP